MVTTERLTLTIDSPSRALRGAIGMLLIMGLGPLVATGLAEDSPAVKWQTDVDRAWRSTQKNRQPLLVFVSSKGCAPCQRMKTGTFADPKVARQISDAFVPVIVDGASRSPLLKDLNVKGYPATFIISPDAVVLDRIDGYVAPKQLAKRLSAAWPTTDSQSLAVEQCHWTSDRSGDSTKAASDVSTTGIEPEVVEFTPNRRSASGR